MLNKLKALRNQAGEEGFTLIELLVVIIIIGILSAIALPLFFQQQAEGIKAGVKSDVRNTVGAVATYLVSEPTAGDLAVTQTGAGAATGETDIDVVVSDANTTITVYGNWNAYTVHGVNSQVDNSQYMFNNLTGEYTDSGSGAPAMAPTPESLPE